MHDLGLEHELAEISTPVHIGGPDYLGGELSRGAAPGASRRGKAGHRPPAGVGQQAFGEAVDAAVREGLGDIVEPAVVAGYG